MPRPHSALKRKLAVLEHAAAGRNVSQTCRFFGISCDTFYEWRKSFLRDGEAGPLPQKRGPKRPHPNPLPESLQAQILQIRREFNFGPQRIVWYLQRPRQRRRGLWDPSPARAEPVVATEEWLEDYNSERPHDGLGKVPPLTFMPRSDRPRESSYQVSR